MTDTMTDRSRAGSALGDLRDAVVRGPAADQLRQEAQRFLALKAQQLVLQAARKLGKTTGTLNDIADGKVKPQTMLLEGGRRLAGGQSPLRAALGAGVQQFKGQVKETFQGLGRGRGKEAGGIKVTNIVEDIDVGVPAREAYNQWTQFHEFSRFAKGVRSVERVDDVTTDWQAKVAVSARNWKGTITEAIPDQRIAWTTEGAMGTNKGVVTFHPLGDNLTKVLLVLEYSPKGFFEKTGNLWRAQGRRVRLDLKHYRRYLTMRGEASDGWRGEIRDGEVVREHDEVVAEEERLEREPPEQEPETPEGDATASYDDTDASYEDEQEEYEEGYAEDDEEEYEDGYAEDDEDDGYQAEEPDGHARARGAAPR